MSEYYAAVRVQIKVPSGGFETESRDLRTMSDGSPVSHADTELGNQTESKTQDMKRRPLSLCDNENLLNINIPSLLEC